MKKLILKLTIFVIIGFFSANTFAASINIGDAKYSIEKNSSKAILTDYKKAVGEIVIPEVITDPKTKKEYTVVQVGKKAFEKSAVKSISLPASVEVIGANAFAYCKELTYADIMDVKDIGEYAFYSCSNLEECVMGQVVEIGEYAFCHSGLKKVSIPPTTLNVGNKAFYDCANLEYVDFEEGDEPLKMVEGCFYDAPIKELIVGRRLYAIALPREKGLAYDLPPLSFFTSADNIWFNGEDNSKLLINYKKRNLLNYKNIDAENSVVRSLKNEAQSDAPYRDVKKMSSMRYENYNSPIFNNLKTVNSISFINDEDISNINVILLPENTPISFHDQEFKDRNDLWQEIIRVEHQKIDQKEWNEMKERILTGPERQSFVFDGEYKIIDKLKKGYLNEYIAAVDSAYMNKPELTQGHRWALLQHSYNMWAYLHSVYVHVGDSSSLGFLDIILDRCSDGEHLLEFSKIVDWSGKCFEDVSKEKDYINRAINGDGDIAIAGYLAYYMFGLCGMNQWKQANSFFPTLYRMATENGKYPDEPNVKIVKDFLIQKGYKPVVPAIASKKSNIEDWLKWGVEVKRNIDRDNEIKEARRQAQIMYELRQLEKKK